ncbi:MAG: hypothetical protein WEB88_04105 [Gemmatimonadota bacterium]
MFNTLRRRTAVMALALPLAVLLAGCGGDTVEPHDEELPQEMQLNLGGTLVTVSDNGSYTPNPLILPVGAYEVSVEFRDDQGVVMEIRDDEYRLEISSDDGTVLTYSSSSAFTGTLTASAAGSTAIRPQLFHIQEGHADFGPFPISVTVQ